MKNKWWNNLSTDDQMWLMVKYGFNTPFNPNRVISDEINKLYDLEKKPITKVKFSIVNKWGKTTLYQCTDGYTSTSFAVDHIKDGIGTLLRCETPFGLYECYSMKEIKSKMINYLTK